MLSCLGPCAKYSSCLYPTGKETLEEAEILMLESYCEKAKLEDGQDVLDLGCGMSWSITLLHLASSGAKMNTVCSARMGKLDIVSCTGQSRFFHSSFC